MSCVQNPVQTILGTECIGDSLPKINSNFSVLGDNVCQLLTAVDSFNVVDSPTVDLTFDSYTRTLSADVKDASVTNAKIAFDGGAFAFRNKIINGGFDIWQRGTSFTGIGAGIFTADRWTTSTSTATLNKNISRQTLSNTDLPSTSAGLRYFLRGSYTSGTNTAELPILTPIELTNTGSASPFKVNQTYTLSFYGKCNSLNPIGIRIQHRDVGSGSGSVTPNAVMVLDTTQILDSNWSRYSFTFTMIAPNSTNVCTTVGFVNNTIPTNTNIDITGVQLEEGPIATPFEQRPIGTELALCQRYYEKSYNVDVVPGTAANYNGMKVVRTYGISLQTSNGGIESLHFSTKKCVTPAVAIYSPQTGTKDRFYEWTVIDRTAGATNIGTGGFQISYIGSSLAINIPTYHWTADAEL